jgi:hypothetical protein
MYIQIVISRKTFLPNVTINGFKLVIIWLSVRFVANHVIPSLRKMVGTRYCLVVAHQTGGPELGLRKPAPTPN